MKNETDQEYNESIYAKRDCNAQNVDNQLEVNSNGRPAPAFAARFQPPLAGLVSPQ